MKLRILAPVLIGGEGHMPGDVVEVGENAAWNIVAVGRGELFTEPERLAQVHQGGIEIDAADAEPENRDPLITRKRK